MASGLCRPFTGEAIASKRKAAGWNLRPQSTFPGRDSQPDGLGRIDGASRTRLKVLRSVGIELVDYSNGTIPGRADESMRLFVHHAAERLAAWSTL
jgi:hypothetical protein